MLIPKRRGRPTIRSDPASALSGSGCLHALGDPGNVACQRCTTDPGSICPKSAATTMNCSKNGGRRPLIEAGIHQQLHLPANQTVRKSRELRTVVSADFEETKVIRSTGPAHAAHSGKAQGRARTDPMAEPFGAKGPGEKLLCEGDDIVSAADSATGSGLPWRGRGGGAWNHPCPRPLGNLWMNKPSEKSGCSRSAHSSSRRPSPRWRPW